MNFRGVLGHKATSSHKSVSDEKRTYKQLDFKFHSLQAHGRGIKRKFEFRNTGPTHI